MSVIFFGAEELGNVANVCCSLGGDRQRRYMTEWCQSLAHFSRANAEAYNQTYGENHETVAAHTVKEIEDAAIAKARIGNGIGFPSVVWNPPNMTTARRVASLMVYNCVANDGTQMLEKDVQAAMGAAEVVTKFIPIS